ncbi:MAG TPA: PilZ domain-containing protein, partial [Sphingomicrobium sp.]|nr:PilZ domain-containing protein [Sphingomicrobium sp.]
MADFGKRLDGPGGRRAAQREPVLLNAALLTVRTSRPVTVVDVSKSGARLRVREPLFRGQQIWLKINPSDLFGTVVWVDGEECGVLFDEPLADAEVASLQTRGKVVIMVGLTA